jgi:hypothetical protein
MSIPTSQTATGTVVKRDTGAWCADQMPPLGRQTPEDTVACADLDRVFLDGPHEATGLRCGSNSAALRFRPEDG